jgi:glycosyltransferase involved in cell wall biosynthesis
VNTDFLVAHPLKHHAFYLAAGCSRVAKTRLLTPLYSIGFGAILPLVPGSIGRKASGYFEPTLDPRCVSAPARWQLGRLLAELGDRDRFVSKYDQYVAGQIERRAIRPRVVVTLQDYMPRTVDAAKRFGAKVWSDQISNQSQQAMRRIERHHNALGLKFSEDDVQAANREILSKADVMTVPSQYTLDGVVEFLRDGCSVHVVPYGSDVASSSHGQKNDEELVVVARANSIRKGGHLLFQALQRCGPRLLELSDAKRLKVLVVGSFQPELREIIDSIELPESIVVEDKVIPHVDMLSVLASGDLFVMPALSESMSLMCVEALCAGLPSLITPYCGVDFFESGRMGVLVEDSVDSVTEGLLRVFNERQEWAAWGARARAVAHTYSWDRYRGGIEEVARSIK